jgi:hypothetical protein
VVVTALAVRPVLTAPPAPLTGLAGVNDPVNLGTLTVKGIGPWTDAVRWGDGQSSTFNPSGSGPLSLAHEYAAPGSYTICEVVSEHDGDSATVNFSIVVTQTHTTSTLTSSAPSSYFGQAITLSDAVKPQAPGPGSPTGTVDFYDATTATDLGQVNLLSGSASLTIAALPVGAQTITATYSGDGDFISSNDALSQTVVVSVYVINSAATSPTITGTLYLSGSSSINIPGRLVVDSPAKPAATLTGTSKITASDGVFVGGTVSVAATASIGPTLTTGITAVADPLVNLTVPNLGGTEPSINLTSGSQTISAGVYSGIKVSGTGTTLKLSPGVYVISGGGLSVTGSANITGTGVMIYNAGSISPATGGTYGGISLTTTGTVNLSAPSTGLYAGILFFQARTDPTLLSIAESAATSLSGIIYASDALLSISGTAGSINDALVVNRMQMSGSAVANPPVTLNVASASLLASASVSRSELVPVPARESGIGTDSVLDALVADLLSSPMQEASRSDTFYGDLSNVVKVSSAGQKPRRTIAARASTVPAGPLARLERPKQTLLSDRLAVSKLRGFGDLEK